LPGELSKGWWGKDGAATKPTGRASARPVFGSLRASYAFPILYIFVPQTGHVPLDAGLPFFIVTCCTPFISRLVRHLRQ
jgi:hypothetical protein